MGTRTAFITSTTVLVAYPTSNAGPSGETARVASISGTTITLNATAASANTSNVGGGASVQGSLLVNFPGSTVYLYGAIDNATSSTSNWNAITVSGTTVSFGAVNIQTGITIPQGNHLMQPFSYRTKAVQQYSVLGALGYDATRIILTYSGNALVVSLSGSTLTFNTPLAISGASMSTPILKDVSTGSNIYIVGGGTYSKITVTSNTLSAAYTVSVTPTVVFSDTLTDKAVNYGGTWYNWTGVPTAACAISTSKYFSLAGWTTINAYGTFS
jgi:hypothetical protein